MCRTILLQRAKMKRVGYAWIPLSIEVFWIAATTGMQLRLCLPRLHCQSFGSAHENLVVFLVCSHSMCFLESIWDYKSYLTSSLKDNTNVLEVIELVEL